CDSLRLYTFYLLIIFYFFILPVTTESYTLSLHDALPILLPCKIHDLRHLGLCDLIRIKAAQPDPMLMHMEHDHGRVLPALVEKLDRKSTRLNSSHVKISYAVFCLKKKTSNLYDYPHYIYI